MVHWSGGWTVVVRLPRRVYYIIYNIVWAAIAVLGQGFTAHASGLNQSLSEVSAGYIQLARIRYREDAIISDESPSRRPLQSGLKLLERVYTDNREAVEGKIYAIDQKQKLLIIQNVFTRGRKKFILTPKTLITGIESFNKLQVNDIVYIIYYYDITGKLVPSHLHFVTRRYSGNSPYSLSPQEKEELVSKYINSLTAPEEHIRSHAALVLGYFNDRAAVTTLIDALRNDKSALVRLNAAKSLGRLQDPWAVDDLIAALGDDNKLVRWEVTKALSAIGEPAIRSLIARIYDPDAQLRMNVAETLGMIRSSRAVHPLVTLLDDEHPFVRCNAAWSLGEIGDVEAVQPLIELLKDEEPLVRTFAIDALQKLKSTDAIGPLIGALRDENQEVRSMAAVALFAITGLNYGEDYEQWSQWWDDYQYNY